MVKNEKVHIDCLMNEPKLLQYGSNDHSSRARHNEIQKQLGSFWKKKEDFLETNVYN